jgi:hypothetical protein
LCKKRELGLHCPRFFFKPACSQKAPKQFPCYKRYKHSRNVLDEIAKCQPWIIKEKPKLDENRIKIGEFFIILHIMWVNVEIFCFIVIFI